MTFNQLQNLEQLEAELWDAADNLRANSKLISNEYCMPVLSFDGRKFYLNASDAFRGGVPHLCSTGTPGDLSANATRIEKVMQESLVEAALVQVHDTAKSSVVEKSVPCRHPSC